MDQENNHAMPNSEEFDNFMDWLADPFSHSTNKATTTIDEGEEPIEDNNAANNIGIAQEESQNTDQYYDNGPYNSYPVILESEAATSISTEDSAHVTSSSVEPTLFTFKQEVEAITKHYYKKSEKKDETITIVDVKWKGFQISGSERLDDRLLAAINGKEKMLEYMNRCSKRGLRTLLDRNPNLALLLSS